MLNLKDTLRSILESPLDLLKRVAFLCEVSVEFFKKLERNKAYTVEMTITGLGSTDPDKPIEKGGLTAAITVLDWVDGGSYEETL